MIRLEFERHVDSRLGPTLSKFGFTLVPQAPGTLEDDAPMAIFEARPEVVRETLPNLVSNYDMEVYGVDLSVCWTSTLILTADLEGTPLTVVHPGGALSSLESERLLDAQLGKLESELKVILGAG